VGLATSNRAQKYSLQIAFNMQKQKHNVCTRVGDIQFSDMRKDKVKAKTLSGM